MSAYRFVTITCDTCGEICDPGTARTVTEARSVARSEGWVAKGGQDECPAHRGYIRMAFGWEYHPDLAARRDSRTRD